MSYDRGSFVRMLVPERVGTVTTVAYSIGCLFIGNANAELFGYVVDHPSGVILLNLEAVDFHAGPLAPTGSIERISMHMKGGGKRSIVVQVGREVMFFTV